MVYGCHLDRCLNKNNMEKFDAIIIGSGQAGNPLATRLSKEGMRIALVEAVFVGGTCVNYGCTPTKTLVGSAKTIFQARSASKYGITLDNNVPNFELINQQKNKVVTDSREKLEKSLFQDPNITLFHGKGSFSGYKEIRVELADSDDIFITASLIFINTGTRDRIPEIKGLTTVKFLTSKTLLSLETFPKRLLIIGGGYVAIEFSQIFNRLGSHVTMIEQSPRLLPKEDDDVGSMITQILEAEGVKIITNARVNSVRSDADESIHIELSSEEQSFTISGTHVLIATGRTPNTEALNLSKSDIPVDERGFVPVNGYLETAQAGIYALGDVKGGPAFTHVSYHDYLVVVDHLFSEKSLTIENRLIPYCVFIDPELGRIGLTEKQACESNLDFSVAKINTSAIARAVETDETIGFVKAIVDNNTKKVLGVAALCAGGGEFMSILQIAMLGGLTYEQLRDTMFAHPTYAEAINNLFNPARLKQGISL